MIGRDAVTISAVYNKALRAEREIEAIRAEDNARESSSYKRQFEPYQPEEYTSKKFKPDTQANVPRAAQNQDSTCYKCHKPFHPGKLCNGTPRGCYTCREVGHKAYNCPKKPVAGVEDHMKPAKKIFMLTRAEARANPHLVIGTFPSLCYLPFHFIFTSFCSFIFQFRGRNFLKVRVIVTHHIFNKLYFNPKNIYLIILVSFNSF